MRDRQRGVRDRERDGERERQRERKLEGGRDAEERNESKESCFAARAITNLRGGAL